MSPREPNITWLGEGPATYSYTSAGAVHYPNLTFVQQQRMVVQARRQRIRQTRPPPLRDHIAVERMRIIEEQRARRAEAIEMRARSRFVPGEYYPGGRGRGGRGGRGGGEGGPGRGSVLFQFGTIR